MREEVWYNYKTNELVIITKWWDWQLPNHYVYEYVYIGVL